VYLGAFRSAIYDSVVFGWANPARLGQIALSPFAEQRFLDELLRVPRSALVDYAFYRRILARHLPAALRHIPFSSPIVAFAPELPAFTTGRDPKYRPHLSESVAPVLTEDTRQLLRELDLSPPGEPQGTLLSRLLNLQNFLSTL
jgi:hypothetical protein